MIAFLIFFAISGGIGFLISLRVSLKLNNNFGVIFAAIFSIVVACFLGCIIIIPCFYMLDLHFLDYSHPITMALSSSIVGTFAGIRKGKILKKIVFAYYANSNEITDAERNDCDVLNGKCPDCNAILIIPKSSSTNNKLLKCARCKATFNFTQTQLTNQNERKNK